MRIIVAALSWSWRDTEVDPLTGAPTPYTDAALKELGIRLVESPA